MKLNKVKLSEVLDVKRGTSLAGKYYDVSGDKIRLTLGNFNYPRGGFKLNTSKKDVYFNGPVKDEFVLQKGDVITPLTEQVRGLLGETARIPKSNIFVQSGDIGLLVPNEEKIDKSFMYHLFSSDLIKEQLSKGAQQTKIRHTSPDKIKNCIAWLPELDIQRKIGNFLDNIDQEITNNNFISKELELMAETIYDYWFLQFEFPNESGEPYKSSDGEMIWNDILKKKIPEGWEVKKLQDLVKLGNGINYSKDTSGDNLYKIVNVRDITSSSLLINDRSLTKISLPNTNIDKYLVNNNDILIARSGTPGAVRILTSTSEQILFAGFIIHCLPNNPALRWYLMYSLKKLEGTNATTTGGSILQNVSQTTLKSISIILPTAPIIEKFNQQITPIVEQLENLLKESQQLKSLRDFLLPMLMNGQVTIKD